MNSLGYRPISYKFSVARALSLRPGRPVTTAASAIPYFEQAFRLASTSCRASYIEVVFQI